MFRILSVTLALGFCGQPTSAAEHSGSVIRPQKVNARVKGCDISAPGKYHARVGDLIELEYSFPVTPLTFPRKVDRKWDKGAVCPSVLGIRNLIVPKIIGTGTYLFYFEARHAGQGTATVVVDGLRYDYDFQVSNSIDQDTCRTVAEGRVGESGMSFLRHYRIEGSAEQMIVLRNSQSSLCGNTGAVATLLVNGQPLVWGDITEVDSTVQVRASPGDHVVAVVHAVPLMNEISCIRLGELSIELQSCDQSH